MKNRDTILSDFCDEVICKYKGDARMKNINNYDATKYFNKGILSIFKKNEYRKIEDGIYEYKQENQTLYVTSLSFEQEPEFEEGTHAGEISQYPLEDILDKFYCHISDFYEDLNVSESKTCYLEFAAISIEDIKNLRGIIGKHVYNQDYEKDGNTYVKLVID